MKKSLALIAAFGFVLFVPSAFADAGASGQPLSPSDRIRLNEAKVREWPELRGRRTPKSRQPASDGAFYTDNLSQKILSEFRRDPQISELPMRLKVSSKNGVVTLEGAARERSDSQLVERKVRQMQGVKEIKNRIELASSEKELLGT